MKDKKLRSTNSSNSNDIVPSKKKKESGARIKRKSIIGLTDLRDKKKSSKIPKTGPQIIMLKHFFTMAESAQNKNAFVQEIQRLTGFSARQIYKWMWDETLRQREFTQEENADFSNRNKEAFNNVLSQLKMGLGGSAGYMLDTIFVPHIRELTAHNNQQVWNSRLRQLNNDVLLFRKAP